MEDIHELADKMRNSLSDYCADECNSFCCRKGYLTLKEDEVKLICGKNTEKLISEKELVEMSNGKFFLKLQNCLGACPQLKNFKCLIHKNEKRPQTCKDFPIFISGKEIKISSQCPAKKDNKFYKFIIEAEKLGYKFVDCFFEV